MRAARRNEDVERLIFFPKIVDELFNVIIFRRDYFCYVNFNKKANSK